MFVEPFVLCVDKHFPECRVHVLKLYRCSVLVKKLANELSVSTIDLRSLMRFRVHDSAEAGAFSEEPQEVGVNHSEVNKKGGNARHKANERFCVPCATFIQIFVPWPESAYLLP